MKNTKKLKKKMNRNVKIYLETYGCAANKSDSEIMMGLLKEGGFQIVKDCKDADINIINTCIVKTPTAKRMERRIRELYSTGKPLIVAGCMAKAEVDRVKKFAPTASIITPNAIDRIVDVVERTLKGESVIAEGEMKEKVSLPRIPFNDVISIVQISSGCLSACSFCETRIARGVLKSFPPASIIERIKKDIKIGFKEFWITSQDNACYGFDLNTNLARLLKEIVSLEGDFFVRVGMMNPAHLIKRREVLLELIEVYKSEKIFKFLHLPLQSGSDRVLEDMNRGYTLMEFIEIVNAFRKEIPDITLETDVIVGYPTESEEDFEKTLKAIEILRPDVVNISKFSPRPHTPAEKLKQLPPEVVRRRSKALYELVKRIAMENNKRFLNRVVEVLVDEIGKDGTYIGRNIQYKPVIMRSEESVLGKKLKVRIVDCKSNFLIGDIQI